MGQSASAYEDDDGQKFDDDDGSGSYYSSEEEEEGEWSDEEEGYESEGSSVSLSNNDGGDGQGKVVSGKEQQQRVRFAGSKSPPATHDVHDNDTGTAADDLDYTTEPPVDLEELSSSELKERVEEVGITRDDVIAASRAIRKGHHPDAVSTSANNATATQASPSRGFYVDDGHYAADVRVAMRILAASEDVRHLRFKLVPAKMKEPLFWAALLGMLRYGKGWVRVAEEERGRLGAAEKSATTAAASTTSAGDTPRTVSPPPPPPSSTARTAEADELRRHLRQRDAEVLQLRRALEASRSKVRTLQKELTEQQQQSASASASAPAAHNGPTISSSSSSLNNKAPTAAKSHKGTWEMDRDSQDFLALDEELKANLRSEKAKRLKEVREQMRFILDEDDVACSNGQWSCCGSKEYGANGCA